MQSARKIRFLGVTAIGPRLPCLKLTEGAKAKTAECKKQMGRARGLPHLIKTFAEQITNRFLLSHLKLACLLSLLRLWHRL